MGYRISYGKRNFFLDRYCLHQGVSQAGNKGEALMTEMILLGVIIAALFLYLVYALLRPENF